VNVLHAFGVRSMFSPTRGRHSRFARARRAGADLGPHQPAGSNPLTGPTKTCSALVSGHVGSLFAPLSRARQGVAAELCSSCRRSMPACWAQLRNAAEIRFLRTIAPMCGHVHGGRSERRQSHREEVLAVPASPTWRRARPGRSARGSAETGAAVRVPW